MLTTDRLRLWVALILVFGACSADSSKWPPDDTDHRRDSDGPKDSDAGRDSATSEDSRPGRDSESGEDSGTDPVEGDADGDGYAPERGDCDDGDPTRNPAADEVAANGLDENCDGLDREVDAIEGIVLHAPWRLARAGTSVAAGDLNGDGQDDIAIGAPFADEGDDWGAVFVIPGPIEADRELSTEIYYRGVPEDKYSSVGWSVTIPGDMDGDGLDDLAWSAYEAEGEEPYAGVVYVIDGPADQGNRSGEAPDRAIVGSALSGYLGTALAAGGDANGDGFADVLVGAPRLGYQSEPDLQEPGRAAVFTGPIDGHISESEAWLTMVGETNLDRVGSAVAAGDFNGDGVSDYVVGGFWSSPRGTQSGEAWIVLGPATGTVMLADADADLLGEDSGDYAGHSVANAGDVNADGTEDVLIGALFSALDGDRAGRAYLLHGPISGELGLEYAAATFTAIGAADWTGYALDGAGDVNADGFDDVFITAPQQYEAYTGRFARVSLYVGPLSGAQHPEDAERVWVSSAYADSAGNDALIGPDLTGDGAPDLIVGAPYDDQDEERGGRIYILPL